MDAPSFRASRLDPPQLPGRKKKIRPYKVLLQFSQSCVDHNIGTLCCFVLCEGTVTQTQFWQNFTDKNIKYVNVKNILVILFFYISFNTQTNKLKGSKMGFCADIEEEPFLVL